MRDRPLVLSLFPGIGLLDMAFEQEGFCVVRGPDHLWGGDIKRFHPPAGRFDGIIGGPPCQAHSSFRHLVAAAGRTVATDMIPDYSLSRVLLNNRWCGGEQNRLRSFVFGSAGAAVRLDIETEALDPADWCGTVLASGGIRPGTEGKRGRRRGNEYGYHGPSALAHAKKAQGLPDTFLDDSPLTAKGKFRVIGNGVPLPMGLAVARAVKRALQAQERVPA